MMEFHMYYVKRRESIYILAAGLALILFNILVEEIGHWMTPRDLDLAEIIIKLSSFLRIFGVGLGSIFLFWCFESRIRPKVSVCSHFLIMGIFGTKIIPWNDIQSVHIVGNRLRVQYRSNSGKITRKESIKHVLNKEDLVGEIREYCRKHGIEGTQQ